MKRVEEKNSVHRTRAGVRGRSAVHAVSDSVMGGDSGAKIGKNVIIICINDPLLPDALHVGEDSSLPRTSVHRENWDVSTTPTGPW